MASSRQMTEIAPVGASSSTGRVIVWLSRPGQKECQHIPPEQISEVLDQPDALLWVDVTDPTETDLEMMREEFGFHRLALEDVARQRQRPKVDEYPGYFFVVMYGPLPDPNEATLRVAELDLFVGRNYVVSCHRGKLPALEDAAHRWERMDPQLRQHVGFLLHVIADAVIDAYFPIVDGIEDRLDACEMAMFSGTGRFDPEELLSLKRTLYTLRKAIYPLREVFNVFLRRDQMIFSPETYPYFQDVYDHVLRLLDMIDIERDMATGALEAQLSIISNRLNETMKRLTVVAICVAILGAVFGAWGMNFTHVPLDNLGVVGFYLLLAVTLGGTGVFLLVAKRYRLW